MKLIPVEKYKKAADILYALLEERTPQESISHREMPTMAQHTRFVESHPYDGWYLIEVEDEFDRIVGCAYITKARELGISIFKSERGKGYAKAALRIVMNKHPGRHLANINPENEKSIRLFTKLGFNIIQHTYERR